MIKTACITGALVGALIALGVRATSPDVVYRLECTNKGDLVAISDWSYHKPIRESRYTWTDEVLSFSYNSEAGDFCTTSSATKDELKEIREREEEPRNNGTNWYEEQKENKEIHL